MMINKQYSKSKKHNLSEDIILSKYHVSVYLDEEHYNILLSLCDNGSRSRTEVIRNALRQFESKRQALLNKYQGGL
jgi:predicted transcriptional regulator